jgi:hypothetical protein
LTVVAKLRPARKTYPSEQSLHARQITFIYRTL